MIYEKLNDFRVNTREAFNSAEAGGFVYVIRHKKVFELKLLPYVTPDDIKVQTVDLQSGINAGTDLHLFSDEETKEIVDELSKGTDSHPTTAARITKPEPVVEPVDE